MNKRDPDDITRCPDCLQFVHAGRLIGGHDCPPDFVTPEQRTRATAIARLPSGLHVIVDPDRPQCRVCGGWLDIHHECRDCGTRS